MLMHGCTFAGYPLKQVKQMRTFFLLAVILSGIHVKAQDDTLRVVNWNIEWFGSYTNGPGNEDAQEQNVIKVLRYLGADIYALNEVVDTTRLRRVTNALGSEWAFTISSFGSTAPTPISPNWQTTQKLAFVYNKNVFSNIQTRAMLNNGSNAYYNFASGRYPYLFNANVNKNGKKRNISFVNIHAKAGASSSDYYRRMEGAVELKDTLDKGFWQHPTLLLGDYNDELYTSIVWGFNTSPYKVFVNDSLRSDSVYYHALTLPLGQGGARSTISYSNVIDHQLVNHRMDSMYIPFSAAIRTDVVNVVPDYYGGSTSDHFPVSSKFLIIPGDTSVKISAPPPPPPPPPAAITGFYVAHNQLTESITYRSGKTLKDVEMVLFNSMGARVWTFRIGQVQGQAYYEARLPGLPKGVYFLVLYNREEAIKARFVR